MYCSTAIDSRAEAMSSRQISNVSAPSRSKRTALPLDTSAAAIRHSPRANEGPGLTGATAPAKPTRPTDSGAATASSAMLNIDLTGRRALVAGVADDGGYGFAIAKALAEAGASVCVGTWPPALNIFLNLLDRGKMDESRRLRSGELLQFEKIYPLDAAFDTYDEIPADIRTSKRYKDIGDCSVAGLATRLVQDFGA